MDHDSKIACISWPDESPDFFVKENLDAADDWNEKLVEVKRFYSQYNDAKETLKKFQRFPDYDTGSDKPLGRGHRFRRGKRMTDSDTETPHPMKQSKLAAPPPVLLQKVSAKASTSSASRPVVVQKRGMVSQTKVKKLLSESKGKGKPEAPEKARLERLEQKKQRILSDREQKRNKNEEKRKQALNALTTRGNSAHHPIVKSTSKMESNKPTEKAPERNVSICLADKDKASKANSVKSQSMQNLSEPKTTEQSPIKYKSSTSNNETTVPVKRVPLNNSTASKQKDNGLSITQEKTSEERVPDSEVQNPGDPVFERLRRLVSSYKNRNKNKTLPSQKKKTPEAAEGRAPSSCSGSELCPGSVDVGNDSAIAEEGNDLQESTENVGLSDLLDDEDSAPESDIFADMETVNDNISGKTHPEPGLVMSGSDQEGSDTVDSPDSPDSNHDSDSKNSESPSPMSERPSADSRHLCHIETLLEHMNSKLDIVLSNQGRVNRALAPTSKRLQKPHWISLPVLRPEAFKEFEKNLEDDDKFDAFTHYIEALGIPDDESKATKKLMPEFFSDWMADKFSFHGQGSKLAFKDTKMWEALEAVLYIKYGTDLSQFIKDMRSWFRNARGRKRGKIPPPPLPTPRHK